MALSLRGVFAIAIPALGTIIGFIWFRKRQNSLDYPKPPDKNAKEKPPSTSSNLKKEEVDPVQEVTKPVDAADLEKGDGLHLSSSPCGVPSPESSATHIPASPEKCVSSIITDIRKVEPATDDTQKPKTQHSLPITEEFVEESSAITCSCPATSNAITGGSNPKSAEPSSNESNSQNSQHDSNDIATTEAIETTLSWADSVEEAVHSTKNQSNLDSSFTPESSFEKCTDSSTVDENSLSPPKPQCESEESKSPDLTSNHVSSCPEQEVCEALTVADSNKQMDSECSRKLISSESPQSLGSTSASESGSCDQDVHSEVSADSGHGGSVAEVSSPLTITANNNVPTTYELDFPSQYCGLLIGKYGRIINNIKDTAGVEISVKNKLYTEEYQLVVISGFSQAVETALAMIRDRFPLDQFPEVTLEAALQEGPMLQPEMMQLSLPEGVNVDVLVSSVVAPNHIFIQQPTHPSFHMLERLNQCMNVCYNQTGAVPLLPTPIEVGVICAAPVCNTGWYRAQVIQSYPDTEEVDVKFVDYGGFMTFQGSMLRQIRSDFSTLPFQSVECYMANVIPPKGYDAFPVESMAIVEHLVHGKLLQAQVVGHEENSVPYIQLYQLMGDKALLINRELVNSGTAQWIEHLL